MSAHFINKNQSGQETNTKTTHRERERASVCIAVLFYVQIQPLMFTLILSVLKKCCHIHPFDIYNICLRLSLECYLQIVCGQILVTVLTWILAVQPYTDTCFNSLECVIAHVICRSDISVRQTTCKKKKRVTNSRQCSQEWSVQGTSVFGLG